MQWLVCICYTIFNLKYLFEMIIAGASMVHPNVPAIVICPICPHSLSFRPIVVPAGIELTVKVSEDTRLTAWISVDGRNRLELNQRDR
jgi:NAD+ kinase